MLNIQLPSYGEGGERPEQPPQELEGGPPMAPCNFCVVDNNRGDKAGGRRLGTTVAFAENTVVIYGIIVSKPTPCCASWLD